MTTPLKRSTYVGQSRNGKAHGRGIYTFRNGTVYRGHFKNGKIDGHGTLILPDASRIIGEFKDNKLIRGRRYPAGIQKEARNMARVKKKVIRWNASTSPNVTGYRLYWSVGGEVNYDSDFADVGNVTEVVLPDAVPSFPFSSGDIQLGVTAVNHSGNESDMITCSATFDFTVPEAPTGLELHGK